MDPYCLTAEGDRLYGLGVSDSKFQLLNALCLLNRPEFGFLVDGAEEIGGLAAARMLKELGVQNLIVIDGFTAGRQAFSGTKGQLDGVVEFDSGQTPIHPGRAHRTATMNWLKELFRDIETSGLEFNLTGLETTSTVRSLTLERAGVRFDVRYGPEDADKLTAFITRHSPRIRQHYQPLFGLQNGHDYTTANFSCALGNELKELQRVLVVPGALPENGNHQPNEWIYYRQIDEHRNHILNLENVISSWA